jgi:hypothetical protein
MVAWPGPPKNAIPWTCPFCGAGCNFEAMTRCEKQWDAQAACGYDIDKPESAGGVFEFYTLPKKHVESIVGACILAGCIIFFLINFATRLFEAAK